jgi:hypothetical protein
MFSWGEFFLEDLVVESLLAVFYAGAKLLWGEIFFHSSPP